MATSGKEGGLAPEGVSNSFASWVNGEFAAQHNQIFIQASLLSLNDSEVPLDLKAKALVLRSPYPLIRVELSGEEDLVHQADTALEEEAGIRYSAYPFWTLYQSPFSTESPYTEIQVYQIPSRKDRPRQPRRI